MNKTFSAFAVALVAASAWGLTVDFDNFTRLTPDNAAEHKCVFHYHAPVPALITVTMPYQQGNAPFEHAELEVSAGKQHFKIPVTGEKKERDQLFIAFWMDRETLQQATLRIRFQRAGELEGKVFWLKCEDFMAESKESHNKPSEATR
jgi:hypothetical protein